MAEPRKLETQTCRTCKEPKDLTEEFWHRNAYNPNGWSTNCKDCAHYYYIERRNRTLKEIGILNTLEDEKFEGFEKRALKERTKYATESLISIYKEI